MTDILNTKSSLNQVWFTLRQKSAEKLPSWSKIKNLQKLPKIFQGAKRSPL